MHKQSLPAGTFVCNYLCSIRTFVCKQSFPTRVNSAYYRSQQELVTVNNNTTVLQTVVTDLVNCYRSYFSDYYSCMLFMFLVNQRNPIPVYLANSEQVVQPKCVRTRAYRASEILFTVTIVCKRLFTVTIVCKRLFRVTRVCKVKFTVTRVYKMLFKVTRFSKIYSHLPEFPNIYSHLLEPLKVYSRLSEGLKV